MIFTHQFFDINTEKYHTIHRMILEILQKKDGGMVIEKWKESKVVILLLLTGAVYFFLKYICPLVAPVLVALLIVSLFVPFCDRLRRRIRFSRTFYMLLFLLAVMLLVGGFLWLFLVGCTAVIPELIEGMDIWEEKLGLFVKNCCNGLETHLGFDARNMEAVILERVNIFIEHFQVEVLPGLLHDSLFYVKYIGAAAAFLAVMAIAIFLLVKDYDKLVIGLKKHEEGAWIFEMLQKIIHYIVTFLKAQFIILLSIGALSTIVLVVAKIDNGVIWGILAGVLDMLPFVGTGIVLIPLAIWQLMNGWYGKAVVCLFLYAACALLREFLEPRLIGKKVGIYPIAILLSVYAGIKLFGLWGILKGPLGLVIIYQAFASLTIEDNTLNQE